MASLDVQKNFKLLISQDECIDVIHKAFNSDKFKLIDYQIDNANKDVLGFLGQYFRLTANVKMENGEEIVKTFFLKSLPLDNKQLKDVIETYGFFRKEVQVYKTIFSQMKSSKSVKKRWHPECFLTRDDIIVFEDLKHLEYVHVSKNETIPDSHIKAALISLARLHASSFELEQNILIDTNIYEKYKDIFFESFTTKNSWLTSGIKFIQKLALNHPIYGEKYREQIENNLLNIMNGIYDLFDPSKKYKNVISHRDLWVNNLMFKTNETNTTCILVDYQICRISPPAYDFLQFLYFNTRRDHRDQKFQYFQDFYYSMLVLESMEIGVNVKHITSHNEFLESCEFYKLIPLVLKGVYVPMTHLPANIFTELQANDPEKYNYVCEVDRSEIIFNYMEEDEYYRDYLYETVGEIIEEFIIKKNNL